MFKKSKWIDTKMVLLTRAVWLIFITSLLCQLPGAIGESELQSGVTCYKNHDYKTALIHFMQAFKTDPNDSDALYYEAITLHKLGELELAKKAYTAVIMHFPNTQAAQNSQKALTYLGSGNFNQQILSGNRAAPSHTTINPSNRTLSTVGQPEDSADLARLPDEVRVPYQKEMRNLLIDAYINGHPLQMYFDSGAMVVAFSKSALEALGISAPQGQPIGSVHGVGNGSVKIWKMLADIKVGQIERKNFPICVQEDPPSGGPGHPLLGQTFFREFTYKIEPAPDDTHGLIFFHKQGSMAVLKQDPNVIPFRDWGKNILVDAEVNGRKVTMCFDTGASGCTFTAQQWINQMGMSIPDDATRGYSSGISGLTKSLVFTLDTLRLGPIIKHDVQVSIIEQSDLAYPLLGNTFFGDLQFEIDNSRHLIRIRY